MATIETSRRVDKHFSTSEKERDYIDFRLLNVSVNQHINGNKDARIAAHNIVSVKIKTTINKDADINGKTFKVKSILATDTNGDTIELGLFLDNSGN